MQLSIASKPVEELSADALAVICFEAEENEMQQGAHVGAPPKVSDPAVAAQSGWLAEMRLVGEFSGKLYETSILHKPQGIAAKRLVVIGGGKRAKFSQVELRRVAGVLVRSLKPKGVHSIALALPDGVNANELAAAAEGAILGAWEADKYKSDPKKERKHIDTFVLATGEAAGNHLTEALERGRTIGEAQNFTRDLVNEPANKLTPATLAEAAQKMAAEYGLGYKVLDSEAMSALGMGALLGVARGSSNPPFLISLEYRPARIEAQDQLALVGKGVTFDTGGISIKPSDGMEKMKYDMAGAAAVIGAMRAIAQLKPSIPVTGYAPWSRTW